MSRIPVTRTPKMYVGGAFIRSESGRTEPLRDAAGALRGSIPQATRKDVRNAVEAAAKAGPGWARRSAHNRGQILYRLAEMVEARTAELVDALAGGGALSADDARREIAAVADRAVHYAGWTDKVEQVLGAVNPVASAHFNFTVTEPMGVVGVVAPDAPALLGLMSFVLPVIATGNVVVAFASEADPLPALVLGEMLATSDLPGGVVNVLTGRRKDVVPTFATHAHFRAVAGCVGPEDRRTLALGAAETLKRTDFRKAESPPDWFSDAAQGIDWIRPFTEAKTVWHPIGS